MGFLNPDRPEADLSDRATGISEVHLSEDGPIHLWACADGRGGWNARRWGHQLAGVRHFKTAEAATTYLLRSFCEMFPEHICSQKCVTADEAEQRRAADEMHFKDFSARFY